MCESWIRGVAAGTARVLGAVVPGAALALSTPASADTIVVCVSGCGYTSINAAIEQASDGDVILIRSGTFTEGAVIDTKGKAITLEGYPDSDGDGVPETILDGAGAHRVLQCVTNETGATVLRNLVVRNGWSTDGAGMSCGNGSSPSLIDCVFLQNRATNHGGGLHNSGGSAPDLSGCTFRSNTADERGGGLYAEASDPTLSDCTFMANEARRGAGMYNAMGSAPTLDRCLFDGNLGTSVSSTGGGMYNRDSDPILADCAFTNNTVGTNPGGRGGGGGVPPSQGGGMLNNGSDPHLTNCTFTNNVADLGGGMSVGSISSPILVDCAFTQNAARSTGGGIFTFSSNLMLTGTALCENTVGGVATEANQIAGDAASGSVGNCIAAVCDDCDVDGDGLTNRQEGVLGTDPYDSDTDDDGLPDGSDSQPLDFDNDGNPDATDPELNVAPGTPGLINLAIAAAEDGDVIRLEAGTYLEGEVVDTLGKAITLQGVADTDGDGTPETVIDGVDAHRVLQCASGEAAGTVFRNLAVVRGTAEAGGGLHLFHSSPTVEDCTFRENSAETFGGGVSCEADCTSTFQRCVFTDNFATIVGGGIQAVGECGLTLVDCTFRRNRTTVNGGAIDMTGSQVETAMIRCVFEDNEAVINGGGASLLGIVATLADCVFSGNTIDGRPGDDLYGGSGLASLGGRVSATNCTFTSNVTQVHGSAVHLWYVNGTWSNCVIRNNRSEGTGEAIYHRGDASVTLTLTNNTVCGNTVGGVATEANQIEGDPIDPTSSGNCIAASCSGCDLDGDGLTEDEGDPFPESTFDNGDSTDDQLWVYAGQEPQAALDHAASIGGITQINFGAGTFGSASAPVSATAMLEIIVPISLVGVPDADGDGIPESVLDGGGTQRVVSVNVGGVSLENFHITNGRALRGGGVFNGGSADTEVRNCAITNNTSINAGGGVVVVGGSTPTFVGCLIRDNTSGSITVDAGGILVNGGLTIGLSGTRICGNAVSGTATDANQVGGGGTVSDLGGNCIVGDCATCDSSGGASDPPPVNPTFNPDGTKTYWVGNDMQWGIQEAIDDAVPGDIIVIRGGSYVKPLVVDKPNLTIRPFVTASGAWETVHLWNPTQGPSNDEGWAVYVGGNTQNTYLGRPRQFRQLPNGYISETRIVPGEYAGTGVPREVDEVTGTCFTIWSRSIDNTGVVSVDGKATIENCVFTSQSGFGGGAMLLGSANTTAFVDCDFRNLYANGSTLNSTTTGLDRPNHVISILADGGGRMEPTFSRCRLEENEGEAIVYQVGGAGTWHDVDFVKNRSQVNFSGVVTILGANPHFSRCDFVENDSGYGTVFFDGNGVSDLDPLVFHDCVFRKNTTIDGEFGGVFHAQDSTTGKPPKITLDACRMRQNNMHADVDQRDFVSPYFPRYRQGGSNEDALAGAGGEEGCEPSADLNGDGIVDGQDLGLVFGLWGTEGTF